ncbi:MarC family protein [Stetteria hydrogenophila]
MELKPFIMLFVVLDPIGILPYYQSIALRVSEEERPRLARIAITAALVIMLFFTFLGDLLFSLLGVSVADFQVAAGLVLLVYAVASLFEIHIGAAAASGVGAAIFPLATPLLAGPGSISVLIYIKYNYGVHYAVASALVNTLLAYPILVAGGQFLKLLGRHGALLVDKMMSLVMAGFAVSMVREGVTSWLGAQRG